MAGQADLLYNNFSQGVVSPKMAGQINSAIYHNGVSKMENFLPMIQGGFTRRPGTVGVVDFSTLVGFTPLRLIPFASSVNSSFIIVLGALKMVIYSNDGSRAGDVIDAPWNATEVNSVQFTQDYDTCYLTHRNHPVVMIRYESGAFTVTNPVFVSNKWEDTKDDDGNTCLDTDLKQYDIDLDSSGNYPGGCAYRGARLWLYSSTNHPFRMWSTRPFRMVDEDFPDGTDDATKKASRDMRCYKIATIVDETTTAEEYAKAIAEGTDVPTTTSKTYKGVITSDCAMLLEPGSDRNDRIEWICASTNLIVGTASNEYMMPGSIDALNASIVNISSYGSESIQALNAGDSVIFVQSGGKRLRAYRYTASGSTCEDLTFASDRILLPRVISMAWQRVPEPRLYCVLSDGTMAVLCHDTLYQMTAWCKITIGDGTTGDDGTRNDRILSVSVCDSTYGQDVFLLTLRSDGKRRIERIDERNEYDSETFPWLYNDLHSDTWDTTGGASNQEGSTVKAYMETERLESGNTIGKPKRITKAIFRVLDSGAFTFGYNYDEKHTGMIGEGEVDLVIKGGYEKDLRVHVASSGADPLTILAMSLQTEVF